MSPFATQTDPSPSIALPRLGTPGRFPSPGSLTTAFATAMTARDVDAAATCFSREACLVTPDATTVRGRDEIRAVLAQLLATCLRVEVEPRTFLVAGKNALISERWSVAFRHAESEPFVRCSISTMVLSEIEGSWKVVVADPWRN